MLVNFTPNCARSISGCAILSVSFVVLNVCAGASPNGEVAGLYEVCSNVQKKNASFFLSVPGMVRLTSCRSYSAGSWGIWSGWKES